VSFSSAMVEEVWGGQLHCCFCRVPHVPAALDCPFEGLGEADTGQRVFMGAINGRAFRQVASFCSEAYICGGVPSNILPQPQANRVSPSEQ